MSFLTSRAFTRTYRDVWPSRAPRALSSISMAGDGVEEVHDYLTPFLSYTTSRAKGEDGILPEPNKAPPETAIDVFALHFCSIRAPVGPRSPI